MSQLKTPLLLLGGAAALGTMLLLGTSPAKDASRHGQATPARAAASAGAAEADVAFDRAPAPSRAELRRHQAALRSDVDDLRHQRERVQAEDDVVEPQAQAIAPEPGHDPELDDRHYAQQVAQGLDEHLITEPVDAQWSASMQTRFDELFAAEALAGSHVGAVDCRTTLCRLDVSFDDPSRRVALVNQVSDLLEPNAQGFAHIEDDGDLEIQIYLSRQGTGLPSAG